jgi:AraC-like DNA-binding protein
MRNKHLNSSKSKFQVKFSDGGIIERRKTEFLPDGSYFFEDDLEINGILATTVIICAGWLLELFELEAGELFFMRGEEQIRPATKCFGIFYPPFSITQPCYKNVKGHVVGITAIESVPAKFMAVPVIFEMALIQRPSGTIQVIEILNSYDKSQSVEINPKPSLLSIKAKRLIDENYLIHPSITRIAARLGVTHEHLSRQFKRDFSLSPSSYIRQLRIADAQLRLARGEEIIKVSQDVGYNDLSRFYKQFRKTTKTPPGTCQTMIKPNRA